MRYGAPTGNLLTGIVADRKRPDVSGPIRSIKMYGYAQCTMQQRTVCCRYVPLLGPHGAGTWPLHPEHPPPFLSAWVLGTQSTSSLQQGWTRTVEWTLASSPTQNLWCWKMYVDIVLYFHLEYCPLECLSNDYLHSTDCCFIFRLNNHNKE